MKTKLGIMLLAFSAMAVNLHATDSKLPEFMNQEQLTKWKAERASVATVSSQQPISEQFYTGKPYVADAGGYVYKYRIYNPEMSRWTSADPSGFPDGSNNLIYTKNQPSYSLDKNGLATLQGGDINTTNTWNATDGYFFGWVNNRETILANDAAGAVIISGEGKAALLTDFNGYGPLSSSFTVWGGGQGIGGSAPSWSGASGQMGPDSSTVAGGVVSYSSSTGTNQQGYSYLKITIVATLTDSLDKFEWSVDPQTLEVTWGTVLESVVHTFTTNLIYE